MVTFAEDFEVGSGGGVEASTATGFPSATLPLLWLSKIGSPEQKNHEPVAKLRTKTT
ncbi:hypothetical protein [Pantanalinema sp. GBBB05]|uniref:hypothetical protein n=1 Tax=Pantanalinema sp. GBBB05 TaxID=2604139 RepID=UPI003D81317E